MTTALEFRELSRGFGRLRVLRAVSGSVAAGGVLAVTGANGSGKSTLLRCIAGLLAPEAGAISYRENGRQLEPPDRRRAVGYVAPDLAFYDELSAAENLRFFARLRRAPADAGDLLLARLGLPPARLAGALSSGMRQRLRWAFALLARPRLLLLDEPFQNLDARGEQDLRALLAEHLEAGGLAVIANPGTLDLPHVTGHLELAR